MKKMKHVKYFSLTDLILESSNVSEFRRHPLTYSLSSIEPYIDKETMDEHYNVHYKKYTENLNSAISEDGINVVMGENMEGIKKILREVDLYSNKLRNNAGGYYNHFLYFQELSPGKKNPKGNLRKAIIDKFGSLSNFKKKFTEAGLSQFGSGWAWLVSKEDGLEILTTPNQDNPLMDPMFRGEIILGMDVWEHAYYLKHKANRKAYIRDFINALDWEVLENRYNG